MKFFDSLVHITPDGRWLGADRYDASPSRLLADMDKAGVDRACLVGVANWIDNATVERLARQDPHRFVPVAGFNPLAHANDREMEAAIVQLRERGFAGIKLHPRLNAYDPLDSRCIAAISAAGRATLPVFLCTIFRQRKRPTPSPIDIVDYIAATCPDTRIVLLHGCAAGMLELFEIVRMHPQLILDLSFTILRYAGSSLDEDMRFMCRNLDQRLSWGSDFPEYLPTQAKERIEHLTEGLPREKLQNIFATNLEKLFAQWQGPCT